MTPKLEARGLAKWYGQTAALADLSLTLGPGVTGLLGPNGAGKTTLLKLLVGQLRPSRGEARVLGEPVWQSRAILRRIGYCPEHDGLYEDLSGLEFVTFLTQLHGFAPAEARARAEDALQLVGLSADQHRPLRQYSKGMRQRAKLAQALAHEPEVLLLDEPLTGLDPLLRVQTVALVRRLGQAGACILVSSHVLHEIEAMTSSVVLIHQGRVLAEGNISAIRELIDRHPHKVRVVCERPRELAAALVTLDHVVRVAVGADQLEIETRDPDRLYPAIPDAARALGIAITALSSPDNNLAAVFHYLTTEKAAPAERVA